MRYIYIDLGCADGDSIQSFYQWCRLIAPAHEWEIFGFDPNPDYSQRWERIKATHKFKSIEFSRAAALNFDGEAKFTKRDRPAGSSVVPEKYDYGQGPILPVPCFDFSNWLQHFSPQDYIVLKVDIEGAEFALLDKMIGDMAMHYPKKLFIEWHDEKLNGEGWHERRAKIEDTLNALGVDWGTW
jgi:FkbM family methyltransferase